MLALRKVERRVGGLSLDQIDMPEPGFGEIRLRVDRAGICGTDLHIYNWAPFSHRMRLPTVLGHEIAGVVDATGRGVERVAAGDFVSVESHIWCGQCYSCHMGHTHVCMNTRYPGVDIDGGFAPYVVLPEKIAWKLDPAIPQEVAALFEPLGIAVHTTLDGTGVSGMNVLVAGCGPIGLMNIVTARALGAHRIIATDIVPRRLQQARLLGADRAINVSKQNALKIIKDMTQGNGVDVALEYSGAAASLALISQCTVPGGEVRLVGVPAGKSSIDLEAFLLRGISMRNIHGRRLFSSWEHTTKLVRDGKIDLNPIISDVLPLEESKKGFEMALAGKADKVLIDPT